MTDDFNDLSDAEMDRVSGGLKRQSWFPSPSEPSVSAITLFSNPEFSRGHYTETARAY